ncbi:MAG: DUF5103 domain-containing protein [Tannerellaceae bacterium]|nr:DUF5103 domain-containing protein [Tannerellaceae bacterium]MCD8264518.1 DUF5103 domain-containing protein [Tannerellaceae bacterium]
MKAFHLLTVLFICCPALIFAQEAYRTETLHPLVKTLQVRIADEPMTDPFIELSGDQQLEINFDILNHEYGRYAYSITHCDANWTRSALAPIEFMNGFQGNSINDFANSIGTSTYYTNYRLLLPNEEIQFKVSGNYVVKVYNEDEPDQTILTACFSVVEPQVTISAQVSSSTVIDHNREHQQVNFSIHNKNFQITYPQSDLKIYVYQNGRQDNVRTGINPSGIRNGQISYEQLRELVFEAGNEFRRFEFLSTQYNGMHVQATGFHNPYYHITLHTDHPRTNRTYQYDEDQNGQFWIRCSSCNDPDTEADYNIVHFTLESEVFFDGNIYIAGGLFNNLLDERNKMGYNFEAKRYVISLLMKQGYYNYQYLFVPVNGNTGSTTEIEGNYYQTQNRYTIMVYFRPIGERYDRLIGLLSIDS